MIELLSVPASQQATQPTQPVATDTNPTEQVVIQTASTVSEAPAIAPPEATPTHTAAVPKFSSTPDPVIERRQVLEQRLTEIVKQRRQQEQTEMRQNPTPYVMKYAEQGLFTQAKAIAKSSELTAADKSNLLARVDQLERSQGYATPYTSPEAVQDPMTNWAYDVEVLAILRAIITKESSGNYRAVNPHSGALGFAQIMPSNLRSWSLDALGREVSRSEFLNSPSVQLQIISHRLNKYWQSALVKSNGDEALAVRMVASLWYSGKAHLFDSWTPQSYAGYRYPSIAEYTIAVLRRYQQEKQGLVESGGSAMRGVSAQ